MKNQRKISNFIKNATLSRRYHIYVFCFSVIFLGAAVSYGAFQIRALGELLASMPGAESGQFNLIFASLNGIVLTFFATFIIYITAMVFFLLYLEQKVGGPTVSIVKFIEEMQRGNFASARDLRQGDELKPIYAALKKLAEILSKKESDGT